MKQNLELERDDMYVDRDIQTDDENRQQIVAYLETRFDVNKKFNLNINSEAGEWVNLYGIYNPFSDFLTVEGVVSTDDKEETFYYTPTKAEAELIKDMITQKIQEEYGQTPIEFCLDISPTEVHTMGGM